MKPYIKQKIKEYLAEIDIERVPKEYRISLIKECIKGLKTLDELNLLVKFKTTYPFIK